MYVRTFRRPARRSVSRQVQRGHLWWTTFVLAGGASSTGAGPIIANNLVVNNILTDAATTLRNIKILRIVGSMYVNPTVAPGATTGSVLALGFCVSNSQTPAAQFDLNSTVGRTKPWLRIETFGSSATAALVAGSGQPTYERTFDIKTKRLLRADDDALFLTTQVLPTPSTQVWDTTVFARVLCMVP